MSADATANLDDRTGAQPIVFDPTAPAFIADPYPLYRRLREEEPIHYTPMKAWLFTRYDDVAQILRDPRFGRTGYQNLMLAALGPGPVQRSFCKWMLFTDPPDHTRLRSLVSKAFTPRMIESLRPRIQGMVDELLEPVRDARSMELMSQFAYPLPVMVICELLGVPAEDHEQFHDWSYALALALDLAIITPEIVARGNESAEALTGYFDGLVEARRRAPREGDLLSALIAAEEQGERLSHEELLATCVLLFFAGHETTVNLIGNGLLALLRHPDERARLRDDPTLIDSAVEEMLRYDGPVQRTGRVLTAEVKVGGQTFQAGDRIAVVLGAANRDPAHFADPERLDVTRRDNRHLAFGAGMHYCLGASLARAEGQIAINTLLRRMPNLELRADPEWRQTSLLRGLKSLPLAW